MPSKTVKKAAEKPISQATIDELIRKHKGKHAVEADCLKSCLDPRFSRYQFVGLDEGVLSLNLEELAKATCCRPAARPPRNGRRSKRARRSVTKRNSV